MFSQEIRISKAEWEKLKAFFRLWENNWECPNCGKPLGSPELATIRAAETGMTYCSTDCAKEHVKANELTEQIAEANKILNLAEFEDLRVL
jgi:hypothetical protein